MLLSKFTLAAILALPVVRGCFQKIQYNEIAKVFRLQYKYTITNTPTANLQVASIDDERIEDDDLVLAIGKASAFGFKGLSGLDANEWYRSIILDDLDFSADELLEYAFPLFCTFRLQHL